ncbi:hypothetical protein FQN54_005590 [Arachnomyces sp. PD_36]|nr:hypothetical protein FQN54_005590 [Arachnomyces sp. PD_36]
MAAAPRKQRRKPVDGLSKLPSTRQEWREMAGKYLIDARLEDICSFGPFSASTVTKEAFLTVRCIWDESMPPWDALTHIIRTRAFFSRDHSDDARRLQYRKLLGYEQLTNLFDLICSESGTKTPPKFQCSVSAGLGPFSMLVNLRKQMAEEKLRFAREEDLIPVIYAPKKPSDPPPSGGFPVHRLPKRPRRSSSIVEHVSQMTRSSPDPLVGPGPQIIMPPAPRPEIHPWVLDELPDEIPDLRTPTETLVTAFMVTFIGGIACLVQRLCSYTFCVANPYETIYEFGPITVDPPPVKKIGFRARIDGSIPFSKPSDINLPEMVIFEAKRDPRTARQGVAVKGQQSMEHVAYIWERHKKDRASITPGVYHTFMISQDYLSFHISIGTYDHEYLSYTFGPGNAPVIPINNNSNGFLHIQEFGPFRVDDRDEMELLAHIILCLMVWQLDGKEEGFMIKNNLASVSC